MYECRACGAEFAACEAHEVEGLAGVWHLVFKKLWGGPTIDDTSCWQRWACGPLVETGDHEPELAWSLGPEDPVLDTDLPIETLNNLRHSVPTARTGTSGNTEGSSGNSSTGI